MIKWNKQDYKSLFLDEYYRLEKDFGFKGQENLFLKILNELSSNNIFRKKTIKKLLSIVGITNNIEDVLDNYFIFLPSLKYFKKTLHNFVSINGLVIDQSEKDILLQVLILSWNLKKTKYPTQEDFFNALFMKTRLHDSLYKKIYFLKKSIAA